MINNQCKIIIEYFQRNTKV